MLQRTAAFTAGGWTAARIGRAIAADADNNAAGQSKPADSHKKTVYISFLLHGNMCYDRYTKQEIRAKFPRIYAAGVRAMNKFPEVTAHIDFPGLTLLSLKHHATWFLDELKLLVNRKQVVMVGCQYAASHALCSDEESDLVAGRATMEILRRELQPDTSTFFPQEMIFHPQMPYIMNQIGAKRLVVMPRGWQRPRRVHGIDGSTVIVYPHDGELIQPHKLEAFYDSHPDGSFVMAGGDFEQLGNVQAYLDEICRLAEKGKVIRWTTVDRYEREVGVHDECEAPHPFRGTLEDLEASPSFSRWVARPEDMIWHGHAVEAMDAIRAAGFAKVAAAVHKLTDVDPSLTQAWTTLPDNPWDARFEEVGEYPETESHYLTSDGQSTVLSRAWHHLLIGLNSDASGWFPWTPRTRHRNTVLDTSRALSDEIIARFAGQIASRIQKPSRNCRGHAIALNPAPARTADVSLEVEGPLAFVDAEGKQIPTVVSLRDGKWIAEARMELPAYGYKCLGLEPAGKVETDAWTTGNEVAFGGRLASFADGRLVLGEGQARVEIDLPPFKLSDPSKAAPTEEVTPTWADAACRIRRTPFGSDLELFTELAWAVWLRLMVSLREDRIEILAEVHLDLPRRIGNLTYDPQGLLLRFKGQPGRGFYDVPYATIEHTNPEASFVAAQRFAALDSGDASFTLVALGGNQSFQLAAKAGTLAANLGASLPGHADTRPECIVRPDGYGEHRITSGGDPMMGSYRHRFALVFQRPAEATVTAHRLRTAAPVVRVELGDGNWPAQQSLLNVEPANVHVTAFRADRDGCHLVVNNLTGEPSRVQCQDQTVTLPAWGVATVRAS